MLGPSRLKAHAVDTIRSFNAGRDPDRLAMKLVNLRKSPFVFLRGTCHLFYDRLAAAEPPPKSPLVWACGDLHLENFGSFKGDNRLVYFDVNDFDESALAPATWDLVRFLASVFLAADELKVEDDEARKLCDAFVRSYASALAAGSARWIERDTARGLIGELLEALGNRTRIEHLKGRTDRKRGRRTLRCDGEHTMPVTPAEKKRVTRMIDAYAEARPDPAFFKVLDVAHRIAGTGSLGLERYVVLVEGKGSPDGNHLLDLKQSRPSSLVPHLKNRQPAWRSHSERIVVTQQRMQAVPMAFLEPVVRRRRSYVLRGLQPSEDRVELYESGLAFDKVGDVIEDMGRIVAWAQLRSSGRAGSAIADDLIAFGRSRKRWHAELVAGARRCARLVRKDWAAYCAAFDAGVLR